MHTTQIEQGMVKEVGEWEETRAGVRGNGRGRLVVPTFRPQEARGVLAGHGPKPSWCRVSLVGASVSQIC